MTTTRLLAPDDAVTLAGIAREDRGFSAPWEPARQERWSTEDGQREEIGSVLEQHRLGLRLPHVVLDDTGDVVGRITLDDVVRGQRQGARHGSGPGDGADRVRDPGAAPGRGRDAAAQRRVAAGPRAQRLPALRPGAAVPRDRRPTAGHVLFQVLDPEMP